MSESHEQEVQELIKQQFGINIPEEDGVKIDLVNIVANRVAELLDHEPELLFSSLYRLDVDESKVADVIENPTEEPVNVRIARLILDRQRKRIETKHAYKPPKIDGWDF